MKLRIEAINTISILMPALLLSGASFALPVERESLALHSTHLGQGLMDMAKAHSEEYCAFDTNYSGAILKQVASLIRNNRLAIAKGDVAFVVRALTRVSANPRDCAYFAAQVSFYIEKIADLLEQLKRLPAAIVMN